MARRDASVDPALAAVMLAEYPDEAARLVEAADDAESAELLGRLRKEIAASLVARLTPDRAARVVALLPTEARQSALVSLNANRAAGLLARLDPDERERCLEGLDPGLVRELRELAVYPPDTAGALMDPRVTSFRPDASVRDVTRRLRRFRNRRVSDVFLVDSEGVLVGSLPLERVVLADPGTRLDGLVLESPVSVLDVSSRDEVVETFENHRIASLPVVDLDGRLLGVLRQRELVRVAQSEATATAVTMVGASEEERALSSPLFAVRKRLPWLQVNLLTAFLAASVVGLFESTIAATTALAVLLPVVAGQSGNTGAQALAVTMRGLALREVRTRHWARVAWKETVAGLGNGIAVAVTTALAVFVWSRSLGLALVIGTSMVLSMTLAGLAGAAIPMLLTALRQDPAQSSSIILTTVTDVVGFFSFLGIATLLSTML
ncbi:MAG TPA: magnesium transporter [Myxococcota bacterium]|nr:magnesium transporter [Myxococcota bacterium]